MLCGCYSIPPFVILSAISFCYAAFRSNLIVGWMLNGMQSGVGAVIMEVSFSMASGIVKEKQYLSIFIMAAAFIANYFYKSQCHCTDPDLYCPGCRPDTVPGEKGQKKRP